MTTAEWRAELKKGSIKGGAYLFYGEEEYLKRAYLSELKAALLPDAGLDVFNYIVLRGNDEIIAGLRRAVLTLPVMADRKLTVLEELEGRSLTAADITELCDCFGMAADGDDTVIVVNTTPALFDAGTEKAPSKLLKALCGEHIADPKKAAKGDKKPKKEPDSGGCAWPIAFPYETPARLAGWVKKHFSARQVIAEQDVCQGLIDHAGRDMTTLSSEIEKLCNYALARVRGSEQTAQVTVSDLFAVVPQNREINAFDFSNAILDGNTDRAFFILTDMKQRKERPEIILASVSKVYTDLYLVKSLQEEGSGSRDIAAVTKLHEYKVGLYLRSAGRIPAERIFAAVELCAEADRRIKSSNLDAYEVLEALVLAIRAELLKG